MDTKQETPGGLWTTLRAALNAGIAAGTLTGLLDGLVAGLRTGSRGFIDWLGCLAMASVMYGLVWTVVAFGVGLCAHRWLRTWTLERRFERLTAITLGLALFLDLYWWTRPWLFFGLPATDPKRLAVAAVLLVVGLALGFGAVAYTRRLSSTTRSVVTQAIPFLWLGGVVFFIRSQAATDALGQISERNRDLPNVLLIVHDALRADVLGCYGNERVQTPRMDRLAREGVLFENAFVQAPFTGSSFGSIFTGKYSRRHGFVKMTADARMAPNITLAAHLKSATLAAGGQLTPEDYHCVTFMTGALSQAMGLMHGFDSYYEAFLGHELVDLRDPWSVFRSELVLSIVKSKLKQRFEPAPAAAEAVAWLQQNGRKRFFAMLHTFSTHTPYDPPAEFREMYCDPAYAGPVQTFRSDHALAIEEGRATPTPADVEQIRNLYYGGVTFADRQVERVLDELERQGLLDNTLVIVTADHGEDLGERGLWEHNHMFQSNLHVPLIMSCPEQLDFDVRRAALVESIDIVPTVSEILGLAAPYEERSDERGRSYGKLDGVSLMPLVRGEVDTVKPFSFAENGLEMSVQDRDWKLIVPAVPIEGRTLGEVAQAATVVRPRLYHLATDPDESTDVFASETGQAQRLFEALQAWDATLPIPVTDIVESARDQAEIQRRLRELGYADGVGRK